jgi:hypothetical protein
MTEWPMLNHDHVVGVVREAVMGTPQPIYRQVKIDRVTNGFIVEIGCKKFVAENWKDLSAKLAEYWKDPAAAEKKYAK